MRSFCLLCMVIAGSRTVQQASAGDVRALPNPLTPRCTNRESPVLLDDQAAAQSHPQLRRMLNAAGTSDAHESGPRGSTWATIIQYSIIQYFKVQYNTVQNSIIQYYKRSTWQHVGNQVRCCRCPPVQAHPTHARHEEVAACWVSYDLYLRAQSSSR